MNDIASTGSSLATGGQPFLGVAFLVALLLGAAWIDVRQHRIPNILVLCGAAVALMMAHLPGGSVSHCIAGIAVGMAMGLPLYWLRAMGAGDVKLMGMVGAFLGAGDMFAAALVIFLVGGVLGLATVVHRRAFGRLTANMKQMVSGGLVNIVSGAGPVVTAPLRSVGVQPYGVAIAGGTILYLAVVKGGIFA